MAGKIRLENATGDFSGFESGDGTADVIWKLPDADGSDGEVLTTDGANGLSWNPIADASESQSGLMNIGAQSFAGAKTFKGSLTVQRGNAPDFSQNPVSSFMFTDTNDTGQIALTIGNISSANNTIPSAALEFRLSTARLGAAIVSKRLSTYGDKNSSDGSLEFQTAINDELTTHLTIGANGLTTFGAGINLGESTMSTYVENDSWVPDITSTAGNVTTSVAALEAGCTGHYVKVGRMVHCNLEFTSVLSVSGAGACSISFNAPFSMVGGYHQIISQIDSISGHINTSEPHLVSDATSSAGALCVIVWTATSAITNNQRFTAAFSYISSTQRALDG